MWADGEIHTIKDGLYNFVKIEHLILKGEIVEDNQQVAVVDPLQLRPLQMYGDVPNPMEQGIIGGFGGGGRRQRQSEDKSNEVFTMHTETGEDVRPLVSGEFIQKSVHMSININGKEILVPTAWMVNGKRQVV